MSHKQRKALIANVTKLINELPDAPYIPKAIPIPTVVTKKEEVISVFQKVINKVTSFLTSQPQGDNF